MLSSLLLTKNPVDTFRSALEKSYSTAWHEIDMAVFISFDPPFLLPGISFRYVPIDGIRLYDG